MASQQEQDGLREMILTLRVPELQLLLGKQKLHNYNIDAAIFSQKILCKSFYFTVNFYCIRKFFIQPPLYVVKLP